MHVHVMQLDSIHLTSNRLSVTEADQNLPKTFYLNFIQMKCSGHTFTAREQEVCRKCQILFIVCMAGLCISTQTRRLAITEKEVRVWLGIWILVWIQIRVLMRVTVGVLVWIGIKVRVHVWVRIQV